MGKSVCYRAGIGKLSRLVQGICEKKLEIGNPHILGMPIGWWINLFH